MQTAVQEINTEYDNKLLEIRNGTTYDVLEMSGSRAVWKEVLSVYSVKVNTDPDNPQEVATMDDSKKQLLKDIFWEMNSISSRTESKSETVITETDDGNGNIVQTETTVTRTYLYIMVSHKTVDEMAAQYGFNQEQKEYLTELLQDKNNSLWSSVLYGITASDDQIVTVALSQIGNVGGEPYWSWYGFGSRVEWCACFVSWCANECGYINTGVIPKFAGCVNGVQWFKDRGQWMDGSAEPVAGMIIHCMDDILELYAEPALLDECGYFVYFLKTVGENDACIFLDENNRCKIHSVNPRACRTYPFIAAPLDEGGFETLISFERKFHFNGPVVHPRTWMKKRFTPEDKEFLRTDLGSAKEIARLLRKVPKERLTTALVCFQRLKYGDYELDMPFLPQYERNTQLLLEWLREEANVSCQ